MTGFENLKDNNYKNADPRRKQFYDKANHILNSSVFSDNNKYVKTIKNKDDLNS